MNASPVTEIFGNLDETIIFSREDDLKVGDIVTVTNYNCEFSYDSINSSFSDEEMRSYLVKLTVLDVDLSEYVADKSNNGGCYAFAECGVMEIFDSMDGDLDEI